jgi:hypothetical protein
MDQRNLERLKAISETFGAELTADFLPDPGDSFEDVREIERALAPRIGELPWELAVTIGLANQSQAIANDPHVSYWAQKARVELFGSPAPPFAKLTAAWNWLVERLHSAGGFERWQAEAQGVLAKRQASVTVEDVMAQPSIIEWMSYRGVRLGLYFLWFPATEAGAAHRDPKNFSMSGPPRLFYELPGERAVPVLGDALVRLNVAVSQTAALAEGCWSLGQTCAFVLTGEVPQLPRVRLWLDRGRRRSFIELLGPMTDRDAREVRRRIGAATGETGKWPFRAQDQELISFVQEAQGTWPERLKAWNERHPDRQYGKPSALQTAHKRALNRRDRGFELPAIPQSLPQSAVARAGPVTGYDHSSCLEMAWTGGHWPYPTNLKTAAQKACGFESRSRHQTHLQPFFCLK